MDYVPPIHLTSFDLLSELCRPQAAIVEFRKGAPVRPWNEALVGWPEFEGVTISTSTTGHGVYLAAQLGEVPLPMNGALSNGIAEDLGVAVRTQLWLPR